MIIGIDIGSTTTKIVGMSQGEIQFMRYLPFADKSASELLREYTDKASMIVTTGLRGADCDAHILGIETIHVSEIDAIGSGARYLSGEAEAVIANVGTGTSFFELRQNECKHIIGTGIGGGTLKGMGAAMFGDGSAKSIVGLSEQGVLSNVDLTIGDLYKGDDVLMPFLTASNFQKCEYDTDAADKALGIINMMVQVVGTMAVLCARLTGLDTVVITGGGTKLRYAHEHYKFFEKVYGLKFKLAENGEFATAIGAVREGEKRGCV